MIRVGIIILLLFSVNFAWAETLPESDRMEFIGVWHKDNPLVCIMEPNPQLQDRFYDSTLLLTYEVVMQWQTELNEYSEGDWYIPMRLVEYEKHSLLHTSDYTPCNIFMEYEYINVGQDLDNLSALGWTMFEFSKSSHQWAYIMTYLNAFDNKNKISLCIGCADEGELPTIEQEELKIKEIPPTAVKRIMLHEFGHALGLGHYLEDANIANNELSLMYPTMFAFDHTEPRIELVDLEVLRYIYNSDGFGGQQGFVHGHHIEIDEVIDNIIEHVTLSKIEN